jgi:hypothetical protein
MFNNNQGEKMKRMDETELMNGLHGLGVNLDDACEVIFLRTRSIIKSRDVRKTLKNMGQLSWSTTAAFRLLFNKEGEVDGKQA